MNETVFFLLDILLKNFPESFSITVLVFPLISLIGIVEKFDSGKKFWLFISFLDFSVAFSAASFNRFFISFRVGILNVKLVVTFIIDFLSFRPYGFSCFYIEEIGIIF